MLRLVMLGCRWMAQGEKSSSTQKLTLLLPWLMTGCMEYCTGLTAVCVMATLRLRRLPLTADIVMCCSHRLMLTVLESSLLILGQSKGNFCSMMHCTSILMCSIVLRLFIWLCKYSYDFGPKAASRLAARRWSWCLGGQNLVVVRDDWQPSNEHTQWPGHAKQNCVIYWLYSEQLFYHWHQLGLFLVHVHIAKQMQCAIDVPVTDSQWHCCIHIHVIYLAPLLEVIPLEFQQDLWH